MSVSIMQEYQKHTHNTKLEDISNYEYTNECKTNTKHYFALIFTNTY